MNRRKRLVLKENLTAFGIACSIGAVFAMVVNLAQNGQMDNMQNLQNLQNLQASILTASSVSQMPGDFSVQNKDGKISIISNVDIPGVQTLSYKLKYSENVHLGEIFSSYKFSSTMNDTGDNYVLITQPGAIGKGTTISTINYSGNKEEITLGEIEMILADGSHELPSINFN